MELLWMVYGNSVMLLALGKPVTKKERKDRLD